MCYFNSLSKDKLVLEHRFEAYVDNEEEFEPIYYGNGFSFLKWPVITNEDPKKIQLYNWGLVPKWAKDKAAADQIRTKTLNAIGEEVWEKNSYKHAIAQNRCLVLSDGFFEWMHVGTEKYPHYI